METAASVQVTTWRDGRTSSVADVVAEECPVALVYEGVPYVVMLATPADLEDFGVGFTLSERLVAGPEEIRSCEVRRTDAAIEIHVGIVTARFMDLLQHRRNLTGRTGCGVCGVETVEDAVRPATMVGGGPAVSAQALQSALAQLRGLQTLNARTGSVHAAAWVAPGQGIQLVREDVGRHNALDKAIGSLVRSRADMNAGFMLITSRASSEMVQKAAAAGISFLAAISAPTALAIRLAEQCGLTLVGFAREQQHTVYTHGHRLT